MKTIPLLAAALLTVSLAGADSADEAFAKGRAAYNAKNPDAARIHLNNALKLNPKHPHARYLLNQLSQVEDQMRAAQRENALEGITLPKVAFEETEFSDAIAGLRQMIETESKKLHGEDNAYTPNFMITDPTAKLSEKKVSLSLDNVPATTVLKYLLESAGATARFDKHAIVIRPK